MSMKCKETQRRNFHAHLWNHSFQALELVLRVCPWPRSFLSRGLYRVGQRDMDRVQVRVIMDVPFHKDVK